MVLFVSRNAVSGAEYSGNLIERWCGYATARRNLICWPRESAWKNYISRSYGKVGPDQQDGVYAQWRRTTHRNRCWHWQPMRSWRLLSAAKRFLFQRGLSLFWVITMYVNGGMIPTFLLYKGLGLTNNFWVYVIPGMVSAFNMLVIRTYMNGISRQPGRVRAAGRCRIHHDFS